MELTGKQRKHLRGLGHHLHPVVVVGKAGLTEGLHAQADTALEDHELVKVRFGQGYDGAVKEAAAQLAAATRSALAGTIGRTALLYRPREEDPEIVLP
jgi:RNA-binding protein